MFLVSRRFNPTVDFNNIVGREIIVKQITYKVTATEEHPDSVGLVVTQLSSGDKNV